MVSAMKALVCQIEVECKSAIPVGLVFADLALNGEDRLSLLLVGVLKDAGKLMELAALVCCQHFPNPLNLLISQAGFAFQLL